MRRHLALVFLLTAIHTEARADETPEAPAKPAPRPAPAPPVTGPPSDVPTWEQPERAPSESGPEAGIRLGASLPRGTFYGTHDFDPGKVMIPLWADVGIRVNRWVFVGVYGQVGYVLPSEDKCPGDLSCRTLSFRTGPTVQIHTMPGNPIDIWFGLGAGYEWLKTSLSSDSVSESFTYHGFEYANLTAGLLFDMADHNSLGPFLAMSLGKFSTVSGDEVPDPAMHQWFTIGVHGATFNAF